MFTNDVVNQVHPGRYFDKDIDLACDVLGYAVTQLACMTRERTGIDWRPSGDAPDNYEDLQHAYARAMHWPDTPFAILPVYAGAAEQTIFGTPEANYAFRYWHDTGHVLHGLDFTLAQETRLQTQYHGPELAVFLHRVYGPSADLKLIMALYRADTIGQLLYLHAHKRYPEDQRAFDISFASDPAMTLARGDF